jgi:hypothetical protein
MTFIPDSRGSKMKILALFQLTDLAGRDTASCRGLAGGIRVRECGSSWQVGSVILALVIASISVLLSAPAASAQMQPVTIGGSMEGNLPVNPGDTIRAGYDFTMPGNHPGATVTVSGGMVQMNVICPDGSAQTLTVTLPDQSYTVSANDSSWYPSGDQTSSLVYQGSTMAPSTLCDGKQGHAPNGATFTANFQSTDTSDALNVRFHYSDNTAGSWSATVSVYGHTTPAGSSNTPVFGREVIVDHQRVNGEPSITIDGLDRIYVSGPFGFTTTASYLSRSEDHGQSFHLVPGNLAPYGKPFVTCVGGGDDSTAVDSVNRLYFADLQGLTDVSNSVSSDEGTTWLSTCNAANATGVDRPWIAAFGDPQNGGALYQTVDETEQCVTPCGEGEGGLGQVGSNIVEITRSQDGVTFLPLPAQQIEPDGIVSGIVTDSAGGVYIAHTGFVDPATGNFIGGSDANGNDNAVVVVRFPNGYNMTTPIALTGSQTLCQTSPTTCTTAFAYIAPLNSSGNSTVNVGQDFSPIAIDRAGNLYVVWSQTSVDSSSGLNNGPSQIYMAVSTNHGQTWGPRVQVTANVATPSGNLTNGTNLFPWIAAGDPGRVDIVWYGTPTLGSCPNQPCGSGAITAHWLVMMAQSLNAITNGVPNPNPSFTTTEVSEISNHYGAICTFGIGCTASTPVTGGGDRGLLDFMSVTVGLQGEANVAWADAVNRNFVMGTSSALLAFSRQIAGPSLYANIGQINGPSAATGAGQGSPEAFYSADGTSTLATGNLIIQSASVSMPDAQHYQFTINVANLSTLCVPATLGGTDVVWLVRWEVPDPNGAGHTYFAAIEADGAVGSPVCTPAPTVSFYDGETLALSDTHGKFLTYNPANTIPGTYTASGSGGVITLTVPVADVGGNAGATLYSITALTATQLTSSSAGSTGSGTTGTSTGPLFNQIDATQPFDFKP